MLHLEFSRPDHDKLVRRVAGRLLEGTLRPSDVDGLADRQVRAWMARHPGTDETTPAGSATAPV